MFAIKIKLFSISDGGAISIIGEGIKENREAMDR
jgi:hypothetical protein